MSHAMNPAQPSAAAAGTRKSVGSCGEAFERVRGYLTTGPTPSLNELRARLRAEGVARAPSISSLSRFIRGFRAEYPQLFASAGGAVVEGLERLGAGRMSAEDVDSLSVVNSRVANFSGVNSSEDHSSAVSSSVANSSFVNASVVNSSVVNSNVVNFCDTNNSSVVNSSGVYSSGVDSNTVNSSGSIHYEPPVTNLNSLAALSREKPNRLGSDFTTSAPPSEIPAPQPPSFQQSTPLLVSTSPPWNLSRVVERAGRSAPKTVGGGRAKRARTWFSSEQVEEFEGHFTSLTRYPTQQDLVALQASTGVPYRTIQVGDMVVALEV